MLKLNKEIIALVLTAALTPLSFAQSAPGLIPAFQKSGEVSYSCGGIGEMQSTAMTAEMKKYPLSLLFVEKNGAYLASVNVEMTGANNAKTAFMAGGPICLMNVPAGTYQVNAVAPNGAKQTKSVTVGTNPQTVEFVY